MATKKQTTDKSSKTKTNASGKTSRLKESSDFSQTYIELRTMLDALEVTAVRYTLMEKDDAARMKRAGDMIKLLKPIVEEYQTQLEPGGGGGCCEGFFLCNGFCVPYPCF